MRTHLVALVSGVLFGFGLALSGMTNPAKVLNFLDVAGNWDPSLALVMGGALLVTGPAFALSRRLERPVLGECYDLPTARAVDAPLVAGAVLFGVGWGLVGLCPGPALASLGLVAGQTWPFVLALVAGSLVGGRWKRRSGGAPPA